MTGPREGTGSQADAAAQARAAPSRSAAESGLVRALGLWDSTLLVIGLVIGSAVFLVTGGSSGVARLLPVPRLPLAGWIARRILSFPGALVYVGLGACPPRAGGPDAFPRAAYGDLTGLLDWR